MRVQILEDGHDVATVSMRLPKGMMDTMVALGTDAKIVLDKDETVLGYTNSKSSHVTHLRDIWKDLQRLPKGEKLTIDKPGSTLTIWIEA